MTQKSGGKEEEENLVNILNFLRIYRFSTERPSRAVFFLFEIVRPSDSYTLGCLHRNHFLLKFSYFLEKEEEREFLIGKKFQKKVGRE
jgi:hypothetical protein